MSAHNAPTWCLSLTYLLENVDFFDKKDLRKLVAITLEKACATSERSNAIEDVVRHVVKFLTSVTRTRAIPRVLLLNEIWKHCLNNQKTVHNVLVNEIVKIDNSLHSLKFMLTSYKRSLYLPVIAVTNHFETIWHVDARTLLFKNPFLYCHLHAADPNGPEESYISTVLLNSCKLDVMCAVLDVPYSYKFFGARFSKCIVLTLQELTQNLTSEFNSPAFLKDYMSVLVRPLIEFVCMASFRDLINFNHLFHHLKLFLESDKPTLVKYLTVNLICECLPMSKSNFGAKTLECLSEVVCGLCSRVTSQVFEEAAPFMLLRALFLTWLQITNKYVDELAVFPKETPQPFQPFLDTYKKDVYESFSDAFSSDSAFFINIFAKNHEIVNKCYSKIMSCYSGNSEHVLQMPKGFTVSVDPSKIEADYGFFSQLKSFPLTQFCLFAMNHVFSCVEQDPKFVISPPLLDLLYLLTLGSLGNSIRFNHHVVVAFDRFRRLRAYNCLSALLDMLTFRPIPSLDVDLIILLIRLTSGLETTCLEHKELLVASTSLVTSVLCQIPKLSHYFAPTFVKLLSDLKFIYHYPDANLLFLYHMCQICHFYGPYSKLVNNLAAYVQNALSEVPHTWSPRVLGLFPTKIRDIYTAFTNFDNNGLNIVVQELKNASRLGQDGTELALLLKHSKYQRAFLCVILDHLLGDVCDEKLISAALKRVGPYNLLFSLRTMLYYIGIIRRFTQEDATVLANAFSELVNNLRVVQLDQLILAILLFYQNEENTFLLLLIVEKLLTCTRLSAAISFTNSEVIDFESAGSLFNFNLELHKRFPESFYPHQLRHKVPKDPFAPLAVYYGNVVFRLVFLVDLLILRFLEQPTSSHFLGMLTICRRFLRFHPSPIRSLQVTLGFFDDPLRGMPEERMALINAYLTRKYKPETLQVLFSSEFCNYINDGSVPSSIEFSKGLLSKLACGLSSSRVRLLRLYGKTPTEFQNYHVYQILTCCALEFQVLMDSNTFADTIVSIFLDANSSILTASSINFNTYFQAFGVLLAVLPRPFTVNCLYTIASRLTELYEPGPVFPNKPCFCDLYETTSAFDLSTAAIMLLLLRAHFQYAPLGYFLQLPNVLAEILAPAVHSEFHFLLLAAAITPSFQRILQERESFEIFEKIASMFVNLLSHINQNTPCFAHPALVTDFFFILKYKFLGDRVRDLFNAVIDSLKPELVDYLSSL